jgi:hypothetical protein
MCFDFLCNFYLKHVSFWEEFIEMWSWMWKRLHVKYPLFYTDFNETSIFLTKFWKMHKYQVSSNSIKWEPSCSMQTDGQTDMTKLIYVTTDTIPRELHAFVLCDCWYCSGPPSTPVEAYNAHRNKPSAVTQMTENKHKIMKKCKISVINLHFKHT